MDCEPTPADCLLLARHGRHDLWSCGLDFEFCSESDTESETTRSCKTKSLITGEEQISDETFVDLKILEKLYVSAFNLVSEEGR